MADKQSVERLDIRIGSVLSAEIHPNADTMYIEKIDVGDVEGCRTIVSGIRNNVKLENFVGKKVLVLCNLKPRKLRGVESNGMILCASNDDHSVVELLTPKFTDGEVDSIKCGERVAIIGYDMTDPDKQLNPKKKYWEDCEKDFKGNENGEVCYKGIQLMVSERLVSSDSLKNYFVS